MPRPCPRPCPANFLPSLSPTSAHQALVATQHPQRLTPVSVAPAQNGWAGLLNNFLARVGSGTTLILLLDAEFPSSVEALAADLRLEGVDCEAEEAACSTLRALDEGYHLYTAKPAEDPHKGQPVLVLISRVRFPEPWWVEREALTEEDVMEEESGGRSTARPTT